MNDFTKEELVAIYRSLDRDSSVHRINRTMLEEIQSMIDNYCSTNGHVFEFSHGPGYCENCDISENEAYRLEQECKP